jgi:hypothetical protein
MPVVVPDVSGEEAREEEANGSLKEEANGTFKKEANGSDRSEGHSSNGSSGEGAVSVPGTRKFVSHARFEVEDATWMSEGYIVFQIKVPTIYTILTILYTHHTHDTIHPHSPHYTRHLIIRIISRSLRAWARHTD